MKFSLRRTHVLKSGEAASLEERSLDVLLWRRNLRMEDSSNKIRTERERERHKEVYLYYEKYATVTK